MSSSSSSRIVNRRQMSGLRGSTMKPSWLRKKAIQFLQFLPRLASAHPIPVVVFVSILASFSSVGLLEIILSDSSDVSTTIFSSNWPSLPEASGRLQTASSTAWKWQKVGPEYDPALPDAHQIALLTLVFPNASSSTAPDIPDISKLDFPVASLPPTPQLFTIDRTQDVTVVLSLAHKNAPELLETLQEIPIRKYTESSGNTQQQYDREEGTWVMKAAQPQKWRISGLSRAGIVSWANNSWLEFVGLLKTAETFDIVIMALVYISMHLTFASLFLSMRRLGSRFSLAIGVLLSSSFAFVLGLSVTTKILNVPITTRLLSEGLPFLVVVIGFENGILLTQSVLSFALKPNKPEGSSSMVQHAIEAAIREKSFQIIRNYAVEIFFLVAGSFSGIEGGFQPFCILASWILLFDCILLFLFYTPILCIRLEIRRIKRHIEIRNALEDDGISHRVAESVAQSDEPRPPAIFGRPIKSIRETPRVKIFMVSCFILANIVNLFYIVPLRDSAQLSSGSPSWVYGRGLGVVQSPPICPFKVASNGLGSVLEEAKLNHRATVVTVLVPIHYELDRSPAYNNPLRNTGTEGNARFLTSHNRTVGNSAVISLLRSFEDPVLDKWIIVALCISIAFNGFLFNAARWGIKDDLTSTPKSIDPNELAQAQRANDYSENTSFLPGDVKMQTLPPATSMPLPTPTETDDEVDEIGKEEPRIAAPNSLTILQTDQEMDTILEDERAHELDDEEIVSLALRGKIAGHALEKTLRLDFNHAVKIRRAIISRTRVTRDLTRPLERSKLPYENYNWSQVFGACCENVVGYMPIPVGVAGPLVIDGRSYFIPMATTEGVLVASASRGAKAINTGGGAVTVLTADGMTRGPCVSFSILERAGAAKLWLDSEEGQVIMKDAFNSTSRFARLESMNCALAGTTLFIRFKATTGDAMGMNMISKGVEHALNVMKGTGFEDMDIITLSGNYCSDKKPAAINWIEGRGKSVVAEAIVPGEVVKSVLKTTVDALVDVFINKNMIGSAMAGSIGGFNAQAANLVAAIFLATGQDPAQVVESANCITIMKNVRGALQITVSMPSIEVGTLGGGTILEPQSAMLDLLGVRGPHPTQPGANARQLARIIAAATMAGELSLCSALAAGHLVQAHMQHNRSTATTRSHTPA